MILSARLRVQILLVASGLGLLASATPYCYSWATGGAQVVELSLSLDSLVLNVAVLWAVLVRRSARLAAWILLAVGATLTFYGAARSGGIDSSYLVWIALHPLVTVLFLGHRVAIAFAIADITLLLWLASTPGPLTRPPMAEPIAVRTVTLVSAVVFGTVLGAVYEGSIRKTTQERRRLQKRIQRARTLETLGILAGGLAHDFNNTFQIILGNAELLADGDLSDKPRKQVARIRKAAAQGAEHVAHMLAYATGGRVSLNHVNVSDLVKEQTDLLASQLGTTRLHFELDPEPANVLADPAQLRRVLTNLVTNAREALVDGRGRIEVRTGTVDATAAELATANLGEGLVPGQFSYLEVTDTGTGIDEQTREHMFDPFYSTKQAGRGLGLAAVLGIVRAHNGAIAVDTGVDGGTRVRVMLPTLATAKTAD